MGRRKAALGLIQDEKSRIRTFHQRKKSLKKKASELSVLCNIDVCLIVFGPDTAAPDTWPENSAEVDATVRRYQSQREGGAGPRSWRNSDLSGFLKGRKMDTGTAKGSEERARIRGANFPPWDRRIRGLTKEGLEAVMGKLNRAIEEARWRMELMRTDGDDPWLLGEGTPLSTTVDHPSPSLPPPPPPLQLQVPFYLRHDLQGYGDDSTGRGFDPDSSVSTAAATNNDNNNNNCNESFENLPVGPTQLDFGDDFLVDNEWWDSFCDNFPAYKELECTSLSGDNDPSDMGLQSMDFCGDNFPSINELPPINIPSEPVGGCAASHATTDEALSSWPLSQFW